LSSLDTQCGFKLFESSAARKIFSRQQLDGFGFDVEDLFIAKQLGIPVVEVPVRWSNVEGTKVSLLDGINSFLDPMRIRVYQLMGKYRT
jgi:dolichyl-phosphate beta-glucosyltransferase